MNGMPQAQPKPTADDNGPRNVPASGTALDPSRLEDALLIASAFVGPRLTFGEAAARSSR